MNYYYSRSHGADFGYAETEFGVKFRFIQETDNSPQIGTFPILEIPTVKNSEFSNGKTKIYVPVWLQKSWGKLTTYGGAGYWINPGTNNKNWIFSGWEIQYDFSKFITLGGELYFHSADTRSTKSETGFNLGGSINPTEKFHFIFHLAARSPEITSVIPILDYYGQYEYKDIFYYSCVKRRRKNCGSDR